MARYNPTYGIPTGQIGPVITYFCRGRQCIRSMPSHYHDRNSLPQQRNRQRFRLMVQILKEILPSIQFGFRNVAKGMSEYNAAFKENYYSALEWNQSQEEYILKPERLILSKGILPEVSHPYAIKNNSILHLRWSDNSAVNRARKEDRLIVSLYNQSKRKTILLTPEGATRESEGISVGLPKSWEKDKIHLYLAFVHVDDKNNESYSNSRYITTFNTDEHLPEPILSQEESLGNSHRIIPAVATDQSASKDLSPSAPLKSSHKVETPRRNRNDGEAP